MKLSITRTSRHRMTDMYVVVCHKRKAIGLPPMLSLSVAEWESLSDIRLERGEKVAGEFTLSQNKD